MKVNAIFFRNTLLICAAIVVILDIVIAASVIPQILDDPFSGAEPHGAVKAFSIVITINLIIGLSFAAIAIRTRQSLVSRILVGILAVITLAPVIGFLDAGAALLGHGPQMRGTAVILFICSACELIVVALAIFSMFLSPRSLNPVGQS